MRAGKLYEQICGDQPSLLDACCRCLECGETVACVGQQAGAVEDEGEGSNAGVPRIHQDRRGFCRVTKCLRKAPVLGIGNGNLAPDVGRQHGFGPVTSVERRQEILVRRNRVDPPTGRCHGIGFDPLSGEHRAMERTCDRNSRLDQVVGQGNGFLFPPCGREKGHEPEARSETQPAGHHTRRVRKLIERTH